MTTTPLFAALPDDEIAPESATEQATFTPEDKPAGDLTCITCGRALTYAGRGRKPIYCEDHKPVRGNGKPAASPRTSKDERLRKELASTLALIGVGVMALDAYDGLVIIDRSADTVDALMTVAEHNPRVRKALEQMLEVSVWAALGTALAGIAVPIAVHHGALPLPQDSVERQFLTPETRASLARLKGATVTPIREPEPPNGPFDNDPTKW